MTLKIKICITLGLVGLLFCAKPALAEKTAGELFELGQTAANAGDTAKAIDYYEKSIEADPGFVSAYSALALIYLDQNADLNDIIWLLEQAADLQPQNAQHYANMCRAYFQYQKYDWAQAACLKALSLDPNAGGVKLTLAWVYLFGKSQPAQAIKYFKEIVEKVPNPKVYYGLGMAYARNNEKGNVLDVITTLRGMGEETLASQLERMVRAMDEPVMPVSVEPSFEVGPSKIVKDKPDELLPVVDAAQNSPNVMHIKLKGKLSSNAVKDSAAEVSLKEKSGDSDDESGLGEAHESTVAERMEKVRRMRGNRIKGRATGTSSVHVQGTANVQTQTSVK